MFEDLQSPSSVSLFGVFVALLLLHLLYSNFGSGQRQEPPGPRPVPLFGNLFQVDLRWLDKSLFDVSPLHLFIFFIFLNVFLGVFRGADCVLLIFQLSKTYGPVFQVHFGPKKVVVLAGYKAVKQALVNQAVEFGNRDITPAFHDLTKSHGKIVAFFFVNIFLILLKNVNTLFFSGIIFSNGDSWKEMRRFALKTLRDFGMGKKLSEDIITKECCFLIDEFEQLEGNII